MELRHQEQQSFTMQRINTINKKPAKDLSLAIKK